MTFKIFYIISFYFVVIFTFLLGGFSQFFIGLSNTALTFFLTGIMLINYVFYALLKNKIVVNKIIYISIVYILIIFFSSLINHSKFFATLIYLIFPILPLSIYLFTFINTKEKYISKAKITKLFFFIAIIQLPIILLQKVFYNQLIDFNQSNQKIASFDFLFGSFFLKSDHSLGFFLLLIILIIILNIGEIKQKLSFPTLTIFYLGLTILLTQSNVSKLMLGFILIIWISIKAYTKYRDKTLFKLSVIIVISTVMAAGYYLKDSEMAIKQLGGNYQKQLSVNKSLSDYNKGTAKRSQIIVVAINKLKFKWLGDGPYSYFDILTGKFKKTIHFSQLIWSYFDLGIVGLLTVLIYMFTLFRSLEIKRGVTFIVFFGVFLFYSVYSTSLSDIAIMSSVFFIYHKTS